MKQSMKRTMALTLVLILCVSLFAAFPAKADTVSYVTVNLSGYGQVIKNWGNRGEEATFLSQNAEQFYKDNNTSYAQLANYSGASSTGSVPSSALYKQLQTLMKNNHDEITSYADTKNLYQYTDCLNSGKTSTKISSFYSGTLIGPSWDGGNTWNREHTWPNSKGLGGSDENDIMMLRPTSKSENSSRGNTAYGESSNYYDPNSESNGKYNLHGDVARIMLYQYVRWGNTSYMWGTSGVMESKSVLLKWMEEDPVDTWELGRNDSVESITGTRNVFVDYPELAFVLFDEEIPTDMQTPSGEAESSASAYTITAQSSNTAHGTVSVSGRTVNATPASGYEVAGYTLISGSAKITRSGNAFAVEATSDCVVRIDFVARTQKTVSFSENAGIAATQTAYSGDMITLPSHKTAVQSGFTFMGWTAKMVDETANAPEFYTAGSKYTVTQDVTLYALYAKTKDGSSVQSNVFQPYSGALTEGDYLIVSTDENDGEFAMKAAILNGRLNFGAVTYTGSNITTSDASIIWHIAPNGNYWTIYNAATASYAGGTGVNNKATLLTSADDFAKWTYREADSACEFINKGNADKGKNPRLRKNGSVGFACYADSDKSVGVPLLLYKRASGTVYYFTLHCDHPDRHSVTGTAPGCTTVGYTDGIYCPDCDIFLSGYEEIPAVGHSYEKELISGDGQTDDYYRFTCTGCGDSYTSGTATVPGDMNGDGIVADADAVYLLRHTLFGSAFPLAADGDVNSDGIVTDADAVYLLRHTLFGNAFPLYPTAQ